MIMKMTSKIMMVVTINLNNQVRQRCVPGKGDQEGEREYFFPGAPLQQEYKICKKKKIALAAGPCWGWDGCDQEHLEGEEEDVPET